MMKEQMRLVKYAHDLEMFRERIIGDMERYCAESYAQAKTIVPRLKGIIYDFEHDSYKDITFDNLHMQNEEQVVAVYQFLCHSKWSFGSPVILNVIGMPIVAKFHDDVMDEDISEPCVLIFVETEIESTYGIYRHQGNGSIKLSKRYTRNIILSKGLQNLGHLIGITPIMN